MTSIFGGLLVIVYRTKAIRFPSGDHEAEPSSAPSSTASVLCARVSRLNRVPSARIVYSAPFPEEPKARIWPSGDQAIGALKASIGRSASRRA